MRSACLCSTGRNGPAFALAGAYLVRREGFTARAGRRRRGCGWCARAAAVTHEPLPFVRAQARRARSAAATAAAVSVSGLSAAATAAAAESTAIAAVAGHADADAGGGSVLPAEGTGAIQGAEAINKRGSIPHSTSASEDGFIARNPRARVVSFEISRGESFLASAFQGS